jgi:hypothetical protein
VPDLLLHHGAVQVVGPEEQRRLRLLHREHDPIGLEVRDVVQHEPGDRDGAQFVQAR